MTICPGCTLMPRERDKYAAMAPRRPAQPLFGDLTRMLSPYSLSTRRIVLASDGNGNSSSVPCRESARRSFSASETGKQSAAAKLTKKPLRSRDSRYPSSHKMASACSTVMTLTPVSPAIRRLLGSFVPSGYTPLTMSRRS